MVNLEYLEYRKDFKTWPTFYVLAFLVGIESFKRENRFTKILSRIFLISPGERAAREVILGRIRYNGNYANNTNPGVYLNRKIEEAIAYYQEQKESFIG